MSPIEIPNFYPQHRYLFGLPGSQLAEGAPFQLRSNVDWYRWLKSHFDYSFSSSRYLWQGILHQVTPALRAENALYTFRHVSGFLAAGQLQVWQLPPLPIPPRINEPDGLPPDVPQMQQPMPSRSSDYFRDPVSRGVSHHSSGADVAALQLQGDPVAPATGEEILTLDDFTLQAPMPLHWQRWYRSAYCERDIGLGKGWFVPCLRRVWQDDEATWLLDQQARSVRLPLLARGEIARQGVGGQRLERKPDDRMILTEPDGRAWILVPDKRMPGQWRPASVQDLQGRQWLFDYDAQERLSRIRLSPNKSLVLLYAGENRHCREIWLHQADMREQLVSYQYDSIGNLIAASSGDAAHSEHYTYRRHLLAERQLASGYRWHFEWDGDGPQARCLRVRGEDGRFDYRFGYRPEQSLTRVTDALGQQQVFYYDAQQRLIARQDADGRVQRWTYTAEGQLATHHLPNGHSIQYRYNAQGQLLVTRLPDGREHRRTYNELGYCVAETFPDGRRLARRFDSIGRLLQEVRPDGSSWSYQRNQSGLQQTHSDSGTSRRAGFGEDGELLADEAQGLLTRYAFDLRGRVTGQLVQDLITETVYQGDRISARHQYPEQTPEQRRSRHYHHDPAGRLTGYTSATGQQHGFVYDGLSRPIAYRRPDGKSIHYQYDKLQRLTQLLRADGQAWQLHYNASAETSSQISACQAPDGRRVSFHYDAAGDIIQRTQTDQWVQQLQRDAGGRILQQNTQGQDRQPVSKAFQYDDQGRRISANNHDRRLTWQYDACGRVSLHRQDQFEIRYQYAPGGHLTQIQLPDGNRISYQYDALGRWQSLSLNGQAQLTRQFDPQGRETSRSLGDPQAQSQPMQQTQLWDRHNCLIHRRWQGAPNNAEQSTQQSAQQRFQWDAESRLTHYTDSHTGEHHYQRDPQGQLIAGKQSNLEHQYQYDDGGNRTDQTSRISQDRLLETHNSRRTYDALGAEITVLGTSPAQPPEQRRFDAESQLIDYRCDGRYLQYGYDALGRRAWRKSDQGTRHYLWHKEVLLGEQNPDGQWQWYLRDPQTDAPLLTLIAGTPHYYELDWRDMPVRLWSPQGQIVWQGNADAWGKCRPDIQTIHQPLRLPGQFEDEQTGLHFNRFRDYDPCTGRYLTPDPLGLKGGINSYRYTPNPVDYVDPLGLASCNLHNLQAADAALGEMAAISEDIPSFQALSLASATALRTPVALQPTPFAPPTTPVTLPATTAANEAVFAGESAVSRLVTSTGTAIGVWTTMAGVGQLAAGPGAALKFREGHIETVEAPDGTILKNWTVKPLTEDQKRDIITNHMLSAGQAYAQEQATETCGTELDDESRDYFGIAARSPEDESAYRSWLWSGGDGSFEEWLAAGKPDGLLDKKLDVTEVRADNATKGADKWSRAPKSIQDQMTLRAAKEGQGDVIIENLKDPRFKGMDKMELKVKSANGNDSVVHYVRDPKTGELMDFKFKKHSTDGLNNIERVPDSNATRNLAGLADNEAGLAGRIVREVEPGKFSNQIELALKSNDPGILLEGQVGRALDQKGLLLDYQSKIRSGFTPNGKPIGIGEVDAETPNFIIEIASGAKPGKIDQLKKLQNNTLLNPDRKPVVLFAPKVIKPQQIKAYEKIGVQVVNDYDQLFKLGL